MTPAEEDGIGLILLTAAIALAAVIAGYWMLRDKAPTVSYDCNTITHTDRHGTPCRWPGIKDRSKP